MDGHKTFSFHAAWQHVIIDSVSSAFSRPIKRIINHPSSLPFVKIRMGSTAGSVGSRVATWGRFGLWGQEGPSRGGRGNRKMMNIWRHPGTGRERLSSSTLSLSISVPLPATPASTQPRKRRRRRRTPKKTLWHLSSSSVPGGVTPMGGRGRKERRGARSLWERREQAGKTSK